MTQAVLAGVGIGSAIWLLFSGLVPSREPLGKALARVGDPNAVVASRERDTVDARIGGVLRLLPGVERLVAVIRADMRVLRRDPDEQIAEVGAYCMVGLIFAPVVVAAAWFLLDIRLPLLVPAWLSLLGGIGALIAAIRQVRQQANDARTEFSYSLSAYCDVVSMTLSAGRELHTALHDAAARGSGWAWGELREALQRGFLMGEQPHESLARLGRELGVDDLVELGSMLALADEEGASVVETVSSKAGSLRERLLTDTETKAASATERMAVPGAMILIGFLWFIAYPAIHLILMEAG